MLGSVVAFVSAPAGASGEQVHPLPVVNVNNDTILCTSVVAGKIKYSVTLHPGGTTPDIIAVSGKLYGCTDTSNGAVTILSGAFKGTLTTTNNDCASQLVGLSSGTTGSIYFSWKAALPGITPRVTRLDVTQVKGGAYPTIWPPDTYYDFEIGTFYGTTQPSITALGYTAFSGGDFGHSTRIAWNSQLDGAALTAACIGGGINQILLANGGTQLG